MRYLKSLVLFVALLGLTGSAVAFNPQPDPPGFGMIGVVRGQTARLNVVIDNPNLLPGDPRDLGPAPHTSVVLMFIDDTRAVLAESSVRLMPGDAAHLEYVPVDVLGRKQIRAVVKFIDDPNIRNSRVLGTLEVFDSETGRTDFVLPGIESWFSPDTGQHLAIEADHRHPANGASARRNEFLDDVLNGSLMRSNVP